MEDQQVKYFAVVYCYDGTIHLWKGDTQQKCLDILRRMREDPDVGCRMESTTVIKRNMSNFKEGKIFGCPKSLDVMQEKPKRSKK